MNKLAAAALAPIIAVVLLVVAAVAAVTSTGSGGIPAVGCHIPSQAATVAPSQPAAAVAGLDQEQTANAATIISVGQGLGVPPQGWVIAIATALQESGLRNLDYGDRDSLGLFQQRPSMGWGTPEQIMDPTYAATVFYERLLRVDGWQDMPLTGAAQAVQRSGFPDAYARHEQRATEIVAAVGSENGWAIPEDLEQCVSTDGWARPASGDVTSGFRTALRPTHYGIDTADALGDPIRAAAAGTVRVASCNATLNGEPYSCDRPGSISVLGCGWYVEIFHSIDPNAEEQEGVVTRYCHLAARPEVQVGDQVHAGQRIGVVGSSGHSSGPHLHFEVELRRVIQRHSDGTVTLERRQTDPVAFMAIRRITLTCVTTEADCDPVHNDRVRTERR